MYVGVAISRCRSYVIVNPLPLSRRRDGCCIARVFFFRIVIFRVVTFRVASRVASRIAFSFFVIIVIMMFIISKNLSIVVIFF